MRSKNNIVGQGQQSEQKSKYDGILWFLIVLLLIGGIVANSYYSQVQWAIRAAIGILGFIAVLFIAAATSQGKKAWVFIKAARGELRKVVWPTRQETVQTTVIVVVMVLIMALVLWGLDSLFIWAVSWLTGQRG